MAMERRRRWLLVLIALLCLIAVSSAAELLVNHENHKPVYNHTLATILVEYASAVYVSDLTELFTWTCERCGDLTKGFEVIELIVDVVYCLQYVVRAYVGVAEDLNAIVIAFRGTQEHSIQNWVEDLYWKQLDINYRGMPGALVHHGFYYAYHNTTIRPGILNALGRARELYGVMKIIVTGHSMGGAVASFCGIYLAVNCETNNVQVMTFGQPRIGNTVFAEYYSHLVPNTIRVTNGHDTVPHLPPYYPKFPHKTYHHFPREVWLYKIEMESLVYTAEKICDRSGEDPSCCRSVSGKSITDHLCYFGVDLMAKTWGSCKIVNDPRLVEYSTSDLKGNFILSKNPLVSLLHSSPRQGDNVTTSILVRSLFFLHGYYIRNDQEFISFYKVILMVRYHHQNHRKSPPSSYCMRASFFCASLAHRLHTLSRDSYYMYSDPNNNVLRQWGP